MSNATKVILLGEDGTTALSVTNPIPVTGGTGGGDATAANQTAEIAKLQEIEDQIGEVQATPTQFTILDRLLTVHNDLTTLLADVGATTDAAVTDPATAASITARLAGIETIEASNLAIQQAFAANTDPASVVAPGTVLNVTLAFDTNQVVTGDIVCNNTAMASAVRVNAGVATLDSIWIVDQDAQAAALDLVFLDSTVSLGTLNSAPDISDANISAHVLAMGTGATAPPNPLHFATGDWTTLSGSSVAQRNGIGLRLKAATATTSLYIGVIARGTYTFATGVVTLKLGLTWD